MRGKLPFARRHGNLTLLPGSADPIGRGAGHGNGLFSQFHPPPPGFLGQFQKACPTKGFAEPDTEYLLTELDGSYSSCGPQPLRTMKSAYFLTASLALLS
jgi:hypothetical protein